MYVYVYVFICIYAERGVEGDENLLLGLVAVLWLWRGVRHELLFAHLLLFLLPGCRVKGLACIMYGAGCRVWGVGCVVWGVGCEV